MDSAKTLSLAFAAARGLFGVGLAVVPGRLASGWIPGDAGRDQTQVILRGLGARDVALAGGTVAAVLNDEDLRPWLIAAMACDGADIVSAFVAGDSLPSRSRWGTLALAGAAVAAGAALAAAES
ncbi:MAG: hypothetical protein M3375_05760 [Actinomycetota bacterium]|nr:hypothetical protein [Actinomycetota bacterium]